MNIGLFEDAGYVRLLPLTWLRAAFELRCGRDRLIDKVSRHVGPVSRVWVREALASTVGTRNQLAPIAPDEDWLLLNARALVMSALPPLPPGTAWIHDGVLVGVRASARDVGAARSKLFFDESISAASPSSPVAPSEEMRAWLAAFRAVAAPPGLQLIDFPWQLALLNGDELNRQCRDGGVCEGQVYAGAHLLNARAIHIAPGAIVKPGAVLDAENGPIHIDREAQIQPNAVVEGPCYIGPGAIIRPGAAIRANTTIGPVCKVGGEVEASIIHGYSNKQHDGFLGRSYVAEWVNLGADTVTSDLKNTYGTIRVSLCGMPIDSRERFIGSIIGDHAKTGIGTILPTGCVMGVAANVFTTSIVPRFVPSFSWLTEAGLTTYQLDKALTTMRMVMGRRGAELSPDGQQLIETTAALARRVEAAGW